jgi:hypothetical protein
MQKARLIKLEEAEHTRLSAEIDSLLSSLTQEQLTELTVFLHGKTPLAELRRELALLREYLRLIQE